MQESEYREEEKMEEKYTQFTPPYPNKYEPDLELKAFPSFTDIEIKNPSKSQLLIRAKEARRLNIIYDNNNNFTEDKNIKEILSNEKKNSNKYNDVYNIDLPNCFMRKPDKDIKQEKIEERKKEEIEDKKEENINMNITNNENNKKNYDDDFDIEITDKELIDNKKDDNLYDLIQTNNIRKDNIDNDYDFKKNEQKNQDDISEEIQNHSRLLYFNENEIKEEDFDNRKNVFDENDENSIKNYNDNISNVNNIDNYDIEIKNENNEILDFIPEKKRHKKKNKHKNQKLKNDNLNDTPNSKDIHDGMKSPNSYHMTTLNINGVNSNEYYVGEIIEKGPNYPSTLGIVKYMNLELFSENYFGEKLQFEEISKKDDFIKIIKLVPVGNKKYIFSKIDSPKEDIIREENDLIILHGKVGQETFYYIMKLTQQTNGISEYDIYKVKNIKKIIRHFKDSIGLDSEERREISADNDIITEGITYDIVEDPNMEYIIMTGQQFLSKYRKLIKKEKEVEEKKKLIMEKKNYNTNFENNFSLIKDNYESIIMSKKKEIENKIASNKKLKDKIEEWKQNEKDSNELIKKSIDEKNKYRHKEEQSKAEVNKSRKLLNDLLNRMKELEQINIKKEKDYNDNDLFNLEETKFENEEYLNISMNKLNEKKRELQKIEDKIFCIDCKEKVREAIFAECSHLLLCKDCLPKHYIRGNKKKAQCPMCNQVSKRIFDVKYDNDD